ILEFDPPQKYVVHSIDRHYLGCVMCNVEGDNGHYPMGQNASLYIQDKTQLWSANSIGGVQRNGITSLSFAEAFQVNKDALFHGEGQGSKPTQILVFGDEDILETEKHIVKIQPTQVILRS